MSGTTLAASIHTLATGARQGHGARAIQRGAASLLLLACTACSTAGADAQCPAADVLIRDYGISFAGFDKSLPRANDPQEVLKGEDLVRIPLWNNKATVPDGFNHTAHISKRQQRAWILRTGGFAGVHEWYGPVAVREFDVTGCLVQDAPAVPAH